MDSRRTVDPDIPYPDQRFERAELMRSRTKRIASWPAGFGLASTGRTYDRNRQRDVAEERAYQGAVHIWSGLRSRGECGRIWAGRRRSDAVLEVPASLPVSTMSQ